MKPFQVDTRRAYELIRARIASLDLAPGSPINEERLSEELSIALAPVLEPHGTRPVGFGT